MAKGDCIAGSRGVPIRFLRVAACGTTRCNLSGQQSALLCWSLLRLYDVCVRARVLRVCVCTSRAREPTNVCT